jgi:mono/diheme cytochrome c family protein
MAFAAVLVLVVAAGCGRVNLEDLTPEAFKTQQAGIQATQTAGGGSGGATGSPGAGGTPGSGTGGFEGADIAAGKSQYGTWCSNCHDTGRAAPLKGRVFEFAAIEGVMRTGTGLSAPHPKYTTFELSDQQIINILAFVASEPAP